MPTAGLAGIVLLSIPEDPDARVRRLNATHPNPRLEGLIKGAGT